MGASMSKRIFFSYSHDSDAHRDRVLALSERLRWDGVETLLDQYVNDAALAGTPKVTVIHGHGSGALRDALRAQLREHPLVKSWRPGERGEGGDGATIVEF